MPLNCELWYTNQSKASKAYALLFLLYMDKKKSSVLNAMTTEQVWKSHPEFQKYELAKFDTYNKNMKVLTSKRMQQITNEEESYQRDMLKLPHKEQTSKGYPFWNKHAASDLLKNDVESGVDSGMKPKELWESREEYQEFPLCVFRKHIYQERTKQLAAPYWQPKRNKNALKKMEEAQKMLKEWDQDRLNRDVDELVDGWERWNLS